MSKFSSYLAPGPTTDVVYESGGVAFYGDARIPVIIGEGAETLTQTGIELHRGSSAVADDLRVGEPLTDQVTGNTREFQLTYFPVVTGDGTGTVTDNPTAVTVWTLDEQLNKVPLRVTSLDGKTGRGVLADLLPEDTLLYATYYFKRTDVKVVGEDLSDQVPAFAALTTQGVSFTLAKPGYAGNKVSLAFTLAGVGAGVSDVLAVSGNGSDVISIELRKADGTVRTNYDIQNLIAAGITTASSGSLIYAGPTTGDNIVLAAGAAKSFTGGSGQNTNTTFKLKNVPVVDGTNGGKVTNLPSKITVLVNGKSVVATALDGNTGLFTVAQGVTKGSSLKVTYYTNTFQDTFDLLPVSNAKSISAAGLAPGRNDFEEGTDFLIDGGKIFWGNAAVMSQGVTSPNYVPFDEHSATATLVDEKMFLRPAVGVVDGVNAVFTLEDVPVDGSGLGVTANDPALIRVYVGADPMSAYEAGPVRVTRLTGKTGSFTLYNPPAASTTQNPVKVFATYWRNTLESSVFTLAVDTPGPKGQGKFNVLNANGAQAPAFAEGSHTLTEANAAVTGLVWPAAKCDLRGVAGKTPDEVITLTFQDDGSSVSVPAIQATNTSACPGILFSATTPGVGPNSADPAAPDTGKPTVQLVSQTAVSDANAITVSGTTITVNINRDTTDTSAQTRTIGEIVDLVNAGSFDTSPATLGGLHASLLTGWDASTKAAAGVATGFTGGAAAVTVNASRHFVATSSRTVSNAQADGLGITSGDGYLNQTFVCPATGVTFTLVDPALALESNTSAGTDYGFTTTPSPAYHFRAGDKIVINVTAKGAHKVGSTSSIAIPGLKLSVPSTVGMNPGDTLLVKTHNRTGSEPNVGDYYYLDIVTEKTDAELATITYYTDPKKLVYDRGAVLPENKLSLAGHLMFLNGSNIIGVRQVRREEGNLLASETSFVDAIADLKLPLPGQNRKADAIVPLSTSETVLAYLNTHLHTQASPRNKGEAMGYVGLPLTADAIGAMELAQSLNSERLVLTYPGGAVVTLNVDDVATPYAVGGEFLAAALCALAFNPANDVATDLTEQALAGFSGLTKQTEEPVMDMLTQSGVTVLVDSGAGLTIRQYVTTSTESVLKISPYVTSTLDYVRRCTRNACKEFIAKKNVQNYLTDIALKLNGLMGTFVSEEILTSFKPAVVTAHPTDPRVVNVSIAVMPMFSTLWINVTFAVSSKKQ